MHSDIYSLPLKIYDKIIQTGDLSHLGEGTGEQLREAWELITISFYKEFGVDDTQKQILRHKAKAMQHYAEYLKTKDGFHRTLAGIEEQAADALKSGSSQTLMKVCVLLSTTLKFRIDYNAITVAEFYHYLNTK